MLGPSRNETEAWDGPIFGTVRQRQPAPWKLIGPPCSLNPPPLLAHLMMLTHVMREKLGLGLEVFICRLKIGSKPSRTTGHI